MFFAVIPIHGGSDRAGSYRDLFIGHRDERRQARGRGSQETGPMASPNSGSIPESSSTTSQV